MKKTAIIALAACIILCMFACTKKNDPSPSPEPQRDDPIYALVSAYEKPTQADLDGAVDAVLKEIARENETEYDENNLLESDVTYIHLADNGTTVTDKNGAEYAMTFANVSGNRIMIEGGGTYKLDGKLSDGQIWVNTDNAVQLILDGIDVSCSNMPALELAGVGKKTLTVAEGKENILSDGGTRKEQLSERDAVVWAPTDVVINGKGKLSVTAKYKNAVSASSLFISGATVTASAPDTAFNANDFYAESSALEVKDAYAAIVSSSAAMLKSGSLKAAGGVYAKDIAFSGGWAEIDSKSDGLRADRTVSLEGVVMRIKAGEDGIVATGSKGSAVDGVVRFYDSDTVISDGDDGVKARYMMFSSGVFFSYGAGAQLNIGEGIKSFSAPCEAFLFEPIAEGKKIACGRTATTLGQACRCFVYVGARTTDGNLYVDGKSYFPLW